MKNFIKKYLGIDVLEDENLTTILIGIRKRFPLKCEVHIKSSFVFEIKTNSRPQYFVSGYSKNKKENLVMIHVTDDQGNIIEVPSYRVERVKTEENFLSPAQEEILKDARKNGVSLFAPHDMGKTIPVPERKFVIIDESAPFKDINQKILSEIRKQVFASSKKKNVIKSKPKKKKKK